MDFRGGDFAGFTVQGPDGREVFHVKFQQGLGEFYSRSGNLLNNVLYCEIKYTYRKAVETLVASGWTARTDADVYNPERSFSNAFNDALKGSIHPHTVTYLHKAFRRWLKEQNIND